MQQGMNWSLDSFFPEFNGKEMLDFKSDVFEQIEALEKGADQLPSLEKSNFENWEKWLLELEKFQLKFRHIGTYINCLLKANSSNEEFKKESIELAQVATKLSKLGTHLKKSLTSINDEGFADFLSRPALKSASFMLSEARKNASLMMAPELEDLSSELSITGFSAWERLYQSMSGKLKLDAIDEDGKPINLPVSRYRSLVQSGDRKVRAAAFKGAEDAWQRAEDICAQALNSIAGTRLLLYKKRGLAGFMDNALRQSRISAKTLEAMFSAIEKNIDFCREIVATKAKIMKLPRLSEFDLRAPICTPGVGKSTWDNGVEMVKNSFSNSLPELGNFFNELIEKKWIDSIPSDDKVPGAFCTSSALIEESRIFMTFAGQFGDISTLAHEAGHAYHNRQMKGMRGFTRSYPMTLAETASTFAEFLLADGILNSNEVPDSRKLLTLSLKLNRAMIFLMDVPSRFYFEKSFYEERADGEVAVSRLKELMKEASIKMYGDTMDPDSISLYSWASTKHFYKTGISFYNYPYTFGYLLSCGLYKRFKENRQEFLPYYHEFLKQSGSDQAHIVVKNTIGEDLEQESFWEKAILGHKEELDLLVKLAKQELS
jgi:oligoendopeptidase F